jgi:hypothetical protein
MSWAARRTAAFLLVAVFLAGGATGWLLEDVVEDIHWRDDNGDGSASDPHDADEPFDEDAEEDYLESLGLSPGQRDSVDEILERREDHLESYWETRLPDLQAVIDSSRQQIRDVLSPEQQAAYDRWLDTQPSSDQP